MNTPQSCTRQQPAFYVPHGGGPCFFMDDPQGHWTGMRQFLTTLPSSLETQPRAILVVSGHWETAGLSLTSNAHPELYFDYYGFPPHTYQLRYDVPGEPALAQRIGLLLESAGFQCATDPHRGLDHGVFVPLKVIYPTANIPVIELSLDRHLDADYHLSVGRALAPLRQEGVLLLCTGMSFHNLRAFGDPRATAPSAQFDHWLTQTVCLPPSERAAKLAQWHSAPFAGTAHPRPEHLLPLMVAAGCAESAGTRIYNECVLGTLISGYRFD